MIILDRGVLFGPPCMSVVCHNRLLQALEDCTTCGVVVVTRTAERTDVCLKFTSRTARSRVQRTGVTETTSHSFSDPQLIDSHLQHTSLIPQVMI